MMLLWFLRSFGYFGMQFNIDELGQAVILNFTIMGIAEIIGSLSSAFIKRNYNRRVSMQVLLIICGLTCFLTGLKGFQSFVAVGNSP